MLTQNQNIYHTSFEFNFALLSPKFSNNFEINGLSIQHEFERFITLDILRNLIDHIT